MRARSDLLAVAKAESATPLTYLLTPNQMLDNDYRLPSYISPSDTRIIPGLDRTQLRSELASLLDLRENGTEMGAMPDSYSMTKNGAQGVLDGIKKQDDTAWVETAESTKPPEGGLDGLYPILALDCEMVRRAIVGSLMGRS